MHPLVHRAAEAGRAVGIKQRAAEVLRLLGFEEGGGRHGRLLVDTVRKCEAALCAPAVRGCGVSVDVPEHSRFRMTTYWVKEREALGQIGWCPMERCWRRPRRLVEQRRSARSDRVLKLQARQHEPGQARLRARPWLRSGPGLGSGPGLAAARRAQRDGERREWERKFDGGCEYVKRSTLRPLIVVVVVLLLPLICGLTYRSDR